MDHKSTNNDGISTESNDTTDRENESLSNSTNIEKDHQISEENKEVTHGINLGSGGTSNVVLMKNKNKKRRYKYYALKMLQTDNKSDKTSFKNECQTLTKLNNHNNIIKLYDYYSDAISYYIELEYCNGGSLLDKIKQNKIFNENDASYCIKNILNAIEHCHKHNICHRDLKPGNIMFCNNNNNNNTENNQNGENPNNTRLVLIDFGSSIEISDSDLNSDYVGTLAYLPPDAIKGALRHGWQLKSHDMWTIGVITYILLCGEAPFGGNPFDLYKTGHYPLKWPNNNSISDECKSFICKLLVTDPKLRLTAKEALNQPWIKKYDNMAGNVLKAPTMSLYQVSKTSSISLSEFLDEFKDDFVDIEQNSSHTTTSDHETPNRDTATTFATTVVHAHNCTQNEETSAQNQHTTQNTRDTEDTADTENTEDMEERSVIGNIPINDGFAIGLEGEESPHAQVAHKQHDSTTIEVTWQGMVRVQSRSVTAAVVAAAMDLDDNSTPIKQFHPQVPKTVMSGEMTAVSDVHAVCETRDKQTEHGKSGNGGKSGKKSNKKRFGQFRCLFRCMSQNHR